MKFKAGEVIPISILRKHKAKTHNSAEAELVDADEMMTLVLWCLLFMEAEGCKIEENTMYQDDKSAIYYQKRIEKSSGN